MDGRTHMLVGAVVGGVVGRAFSDASAYSFGGGWVLAALTGVFGAVLPDIDHGESAFWRLAAGIAGLGALLLLLKGRYLAAAAAFLGVALAAVVLTRLLGHRGVTHSLAGPVIMLFVAGLLAPLVGSRVSAADVAVISAAYLSHLWLDMLTPAGVPLLWPWQRRFGAGAAFVLLGAGVLVAVVPALRGRVVQLALDAARGLAEALSGATDAALKLAEAAFSR